MRTQRNYFYQTREPEKTGKKLFLTNSKQIKIKKPLKINQNPMSIIR